MMLKPMLGPRIKRLRPHILPSRLNGQAYRCSSGSQQAVATSETGYFEWNSGSKFLLARQEWSNSSIIRNWSSFSDRKPCLLFWESHFPITV